MSYLACLVRKVLLSQSRLVGDNGASADTHVELLGRAFLVI